MYSIIMLWLGPKAYFIYKPWIFHTGVLTQKRSSKLLPIQSLQCCLLIGDSHFDAVISNWKEIWTRWCEYLLEKSTFSIISIQICTLLIGWLALSILWWPLDGALISDWISIPFRNLYWISAAAPSVWKQWEKQVQ